MSKAQTISNFTFFCYLILFSNSIRIKKNKSTQSTQVDTIIVSGSTTDSYNVNQNPSTPSSGCIMVFKEQGFNGASQQFCVDQSDLGHVSGWNDSINSLIIGPNMYVIVYKDENFSNNYQTISSNTSVQTFYGTALQNAISSFAFYPNQYYALLYTNCNYGGYMALISSNVANLGSTFGSGFANSISSIKVGTNTGVVLYQNSNYSGSSYATNSNVSCLTSANFNDKANSVMIGEGHGCGEYFTSCTNFKQGQGIYTCSQVNNAVVVGYIPGVNTNVMLFTSSFDEILKSGSACAANTYNGISFYT